MDINQRHVNPRGYLVDALGNVINYSGVVIFRVSELDVNGEIPAPYLDGDEDYRRKLNRLQKKKDLLNKNGKKGNMIPKPPKAGTRTEKKHPRN